MTFNHIIKNIDSLPPLSNAAYVVQKLYASGLENINITRLVKVIESDAMLAANILKMINSPYYGLSRRVATISQAVTLLGASRIHMLVINYAINEKLKADPSIYGFTNTQLNELCNLQSSLMFRWYSTINVQVAKFLSSLALIMESGKLILAEEVIASDYTGEFRKGFNECESIQEYEKSVINTTSYYLTALLFEHWKLEPTYVKLLKSLDFQEKEKQPVNKVKKAYMNALDVVRTSINLKDILSDAGIEKASLIVAEMGHDQKVFKDIAVNLRETYLEKLDA